MDKKEKEMKGLFSDPHVLKELRAIRRTVEQTLCETKKDNGASVDQLRGVFNPILRDLRKIRNKLADATGNKAPGSPAHE